jgi:hypothetical protein
MTSKPASPWNFALAFREKWFAALSGSASVPFYFLAIFLDNAYAKVIAGVMAFVCSWFAAYRVWKAEREKVIELEQALKRPHKAQLMSFYIEAGELLTNFPFPEDIDHREQRIKEINDFIKRASSWIGTNMGPISQAKFLDLGSEGTDGNATEWKLRLRRRNLSQLIESDHWG